MHKKIWLPLGMVGFLMVGCSETDEPVSVSADAHDASEVGVDAAESTGPMADDFEASIKKEGHDRVHFDFDRSCVRHDGNHALEAQAKWLLANKEASIEIQGYCDKRGPIEYNFKLGQRRADAVADRLVHLGVERHRVKTVSFGRSVLLFEGETDEMHQKNRVALTVVRPAEAN